METLYNITFQQLEFFLTAAETKYIYKAADALFVSQPDVSKWIRRLEKEIGVKLFDRTHYGLRLTPQGSYLYSKCYPLYNRFCRAIENTRNINDNVSDCIRIGCLNSFCSIRTMKNYIRRFKEMRPEVVAYEELHEYNELNQLLISGKVDVVFSTSFALDGLPNVTCKNVARTDLYIALPSTHPLASRENVHLHELSEETFCVLAPEIVKSGTDRLLDMCMKNGFYPKNIRYVPNISTLILLLKQGLGVTISGYIAEDPDIKMFPVEELNENTYESLAWRTNELSRAAQEFVDMAGD